MKIINELPRLIECLKKWKEVPSAEEFHALYEKPVSAWIGPMLEDFSGRITDGLHENLADLDWTSYRADTLKLDPEAEERRLRRHILAVEELLGSKLEGEAVLFGAFTAMDGYARFDRGTHRVYLGVDESHHRGAYLDVLLTHELTHVVRESRATVWTGWGLDPKMTHDEFTENLPVIEHLFNEGFSCVVSEILNPGETPGGYAYQEPDGLGQILLHGPAIDRVVHQELKKKDGDYGRLYNVGAYRPPVPRYAHYVWAWQWAKGLVREYGDGDLRKGARAIAGVCSKEFIGNALDFKLPAKI